MTQRKDHILIIGSGFAGLAMAIRLKQSGIDDFTVLERAEQVGGVWRDNTYPGVACDVPSPLYSLSFAPNPGWTRLFAPQSEILAYLEDCAVRFNVKRHIRFSAGVVDARFDDATGLWTVRASDGSVHVARIVVSGAGNALTVPVVPDFKGMQGFRGAKFHSARWDHKTSLDGKRVAVIGTGASAIQIVPSIADRVASLTLFQRTAPWVLPRPDRAVPPSERAFYARHPAAQKLLRATIYTVMEAMALGYVVDPRLNKLREAQALKYLARTVPDPTLRAKLTPTFRMGCKRVLFSNDYYPALTRPHVEVVTDRIDAFTPDGITTADGLERPFDAVVFATGFEAADVRSSFSLRGRDGIDLNDAWRDGMEAYLGTSVTGFPNLFMLVGPNTGLGHSSMVHMIESQVAYVLDAIKTVRRENLQQVEVRPDAQRTYNDWLQLRLKRTVWNTGCQSWYVSRSGRNTTVWPGFTWEFRLRTRSFDAHRYVLTPSVTPTVRPSAAAPRDAACVM